MTKIEWTEATWNPIVGCSIVSPGCTNCYAMRQAARLLDKPGSHYEGTTRRVNGNAVWTGKVALAPDRILLQPLRTRKPTMWFVNSMGDLFHEDVPNEWIDKVFAVMALCPQHTFQVLTKRSARMLDYVGTMAGDYNLRLPEAAGVVDRDLWPAHVAHMQWPLPNVWLGVSAEDQRRLVDRSADLEATPAAVRFVSGEPLLSALDLDLGPHDCPQCNGCGSIEAWGGEPGGQQCPSCGGSGGVYRRLDWIIVGGESGPNARPMHPDWARSIRDQCAAAGVSFFMKQMTKKAPIPPDLQVRQWPMQFDREAA